MGGKIILLGEKESERDEEKAGNTALVGAS